MPIADLVTGRLPAPIDGRAQHVVGVLPPARALGPFGPGPGLSVSFLAGRFPFSGGPSAAITGENFNGRRPNGGRGERQA